MYLTKAVSKYSRSGISAVVLSLAGKIPPYPDEKMLKNRKADINFIILRMKVSLFAIDLMKKWHL